MVDNVIPPRRREEIFDERGEPTLRFIKWMELVTGGQNDVVQIVDDNNQDNIGALTSKIFTLQNQVGSGIPLTIDTTGFTVDTTKQFTDQTEV